MDDLQVLGQVRALAREGRTVEAVRLAETLPDEVHGAIAKVEARYWAGDLAGALALARPSLEAWPMEPQLLLLGSELALQLLRPEEALRWADRLIALDASSLDPAAHAFYRERGAVLAAEARTSAAWERRHQGVTRTTRVGAVVGLLLCIGATVLLARDSGRGNVRR